MKVFLAGVIQGSKIAAEIHSQDWRGQIQAAVQRRLPQAEVYCHYSMHPNSIAYDMPAIRSTFAEGLKRAGECDLLVAYLPIASMGTAIEMHQARAAGAVVLAISPMTANWVLRIYCDRVFADVQAFEDFLAGGELAELMSRRRKH